MHVRSVSVEDPHDLYGQIALHAVAVEKRFGTPFAFVVTGTDADGVHIAPVTFHLRVHCRVAVDLAGAGLQYLGVEPLGKPQHIDRSMHTSLDRLHRVTLIMYGRSRTGKVVYFVALNVKGESHIVPDNFKPGIVQQLVYIAFAAGEKVVNTNNFIAHIEQSFTKGTAQKAATASNQNPFHKLSFYKYITTFYFKIA